MLAVLSHWHGKPSPYTHIVMDAQRKWLELCQSCSPQEEIRALYFHRGYILATALLRSTSTAGSGSRTSTGLWLCLSEGKFRNAVNEANYGQVTAVGLRATAGSHPLPLLSILFICLLSVLFQIPLILSYYFGRSWWLTW